MKPIQIEDGYNKHFIFDGGIAHLKVAADDCIITDFNGNELMFFNDGERVYSQIVVEMSVAYEERTKIIENINDNLKTIARALLSINDSVGAEP